MAQTLPSGIKKWDPSDPVTRSAFNDQWETIDTQLVSMNDQFFEAEPIEKKINIYDYQAPATAPYNTFTITKDQHSELGSGTGQNTALMVFNSIGPDVTGQEVGIFSVLNVIGNAKQHVGMYSQVNVFGDSPFIYSGGCVEVANTRLDGSGSDVDHALVGWEVDIVNKYAYSGVDDPLKRKTGVSVVAFGGGSGTEALAVYSSYQLNGNGTYNSGDWIYGLIMRHDSLNVNLGTGIKIESDHAIGMRITGKSKVIGIDLAGASAEPGSVGININANYSVAMAVPANKFVKMNGAGGNEGLFYDPVADAITFAANKLSLLYHTAATSATAGSSGAIPSQVAGYIKCIVGGVERRIPFYNV